MVELVICVTSSTVARYAGNLLVLLLYCLATLILPELRPVSKGPFQKAIR